MTTIKAELVAKEHDLMGYGTYVFKTIGENCPFGYKYRMITRLPNWQCSEIEVGEIGYVTYMECQAGIDKWYCPETGEMIPYKYTNIYFVKFVKEQDNSTKDIII